MRRPRGPWLWAGGIAGAMAGLMTAQLVGLPDVAPLAREYPTTTAFIQRYQARLREEGKGGTIQWRPVPLGRIARTLALAVIVSEDIGFFSHKGFEVAEMRIAVRDAVQKGTAPRGASTITQQLAKNLWLSPSRNPLRKLREAALTRRLERTLSKDRILELYLNVVEFGPGVYGAEAAAWAYFGKPAAELDDHESALLAASLPRPSTWHPGSESASYHRQVEIIQGRMQRTVFLRRRLGFPDADATVLLPDSLLSPDSLMAPDSVMAGDTTLAPDTMPPDTTLPDTIRPDTIPRPARE